MSNPTSEASARFGVSNGNIVSRFPEPSTPERIAERRAYADKELAESIKVATSAFFPTTRRKSWKRKIWRSVRYWQACVDRMKNGDPGMRAEWAIQWRDMYDNLAKSIGGLKNFTDGDGVRVLA